MTVIMPATFHSHGMPSVRASLSRCLEPFAAYRVSEGESITSYENTPGYLSAVKWNTREWGMAEDDSSPSYFSHARDADGWLVGMHASTRRGRRCPH